MPQGCPEFARGGGGGGVGVKAVEGYRSPRPGGIRDGLEHDEHSWGLRRGVGMADGGLVEMRRMPVWGWGFIMQVAGGKWVMRHKCPELFNRAGPARSGTPRPSSVPHTGLRRVDCHLSAPGGEDTVAGQGGFLTLDHDPSSVAEPLRRVDLNHNLDQFGFSVSRKQTGWCHPAGVVIALLWLPGVSRGDTPGYSNGIPSRWQGSAPVLRSSSVHPPQWFCYGGRATEGRPHPHRLRRGSSELLESGCKFVWQDAGSEWVMALDCPEFARGDGGRGGGRSGGSR